MAKKNINYFTIIQQSSDGGTNPPPDTDPAPAEYLPISKPSLTLTASPLELSYGTCTVNGNVYSTDKTFDGKHTATDWLVSDISDVDFTNPVDFSYKDSENLLSYIPKGMVIGTRYWIKCRYRSGDVVSEWSDPVTYLNNGLIDLNHDGMDIKTITDIDSTVKLHKQPYVRVNKSIVTGTPGSATLTQEGFIVEILNNDLDVVYKEFIEVTNGQGGCFIPSGYLEQGKFYFIRTYTKWSIDDGTNTTIKYSEVLFEYLEVASFNYVNKTWSPSLTLPDVNVIGSNQGNTGGVIEDNLFYIVGQSGIFSAKPGDSSWATRSVPSGGFYKSSSSILPDNSIIVTGSYNSTNRPKAFYFKYNPVLPERWEPAVEIASLNQPRHAHAQITLPNGKIMIVGGKDTSPVINPPESEVVEIYDLETDTWTVMNKCPVRKIEGQLVPMPDGRVMYLSGSNNTYQYKGSITCALYDYKTDSWEVVTEYPVGYVYDDSSAYFGHVRGTLDLTDEIFTYGGKNRLNNYVSDVKHYNQEINSWRLGANGPVAAGEVILAASYSEGLVLLTNTISQPNKVYVFN